LFALIAIVFIGSTQGIATSTPSVTVTVKAGKSLGTIPTYAIGLNTAAWDPRFTDSQLPGLLKQIGITMMRFPGGLTADTYHWQSNSLTPAHTGLSFKPAAGSKFDAFMDLAQHTGAKVMITVNYGTNAAGTGPGDPNEAAAWVKYANITKHYGIKYWEIGNEVYGDGFYGPTWETDLNTQKGPTAYATGAISFTTAMKALDPSIKVGVVLATPGRFLDGQQPDWNSGVLSTECSKIDIVILHFYP
jgi:alpha-L-arabinofuranosidase